MHFPACKFDCTSQSQRDLQLQFICLYCNIIAHYFDLKCDCEICAKISHNYRFCVLTPRQIQISIGMTGRMTT